MRLALPVSAMALSLVSASAGAAEGMPQLDFGNPLMTSQIVWLVIIFAVLYVAIGRWALPTVASVLEHRATVIATDLEAARRDKAEADAAIEAQSVGTRAAQAQAQHQLATAIADAKTAAAARSAEQNARLDVQLHEAEGRIHAARATALGALREVAIDTASAVVARLSGVAPDRSLVDREVETAMAARAA